MNSVLQALRQKRLKWVESNRENGFDEGINRLLTELYPDNAHFIYELLQNAEDPEATIVEFELTDDSIKFVHNGKRLFSPKDVESITSIGNSTKRDDATSIGKFGVGFKAVFAYTNTPEIHSGEFHFRIHDLVVPDTDNLVDSAFDTKKTSFIFPFDNPKKPAKTAISEIHKGLIDLGDNTLLFLNHIREISYQLPSGENGFIQRLDHNNGHIEIKTQHPGQEESISHWLRFAKEIEIIDDDGKQKICSIAIAYSLVEELDKKSNNKRWKIVPLKQGQVSIYFPAEKETSNLRFHIHAPFASTVARDSVRDCEANHRLRDGISELVIESLLSIRDQGLLTVGFLAVLPNPTDNLAGNAPFYEPIRKAVVESFKTTNLTPMKRGGYARADGIFKGPADISDIVDDNDLALLLGEGYEVPMWVANSPQKYQREDRFLESLNIEEWSWTELVESLSFLDDDYIERRNTWIETKEDTWLLKFYALLGQAISSHEESLYGCDIALVRVILPSGEDGHVEPSEAFFMQDNEEIKPPKDLLFVKPTVYSVGRSEPQKKFAKIFLESAGVRYYDLDASVEIRLNQYYYPPQKIDDSYYQDIIFFVAYYHTFPSKKDIFLKKRFFLGQSDSDEFPCWSELSQLCLDEPYFNSGLSGLYYGHSKRPLWRGYKKNLNATQLKGFIELAAALGIMKNLEVSQAFVWKNKRYYSELLKDKHNGKRESRATCIEEDYSIENIDKYLDKISHASARLIWNSVIKANSKCAKARYRPNQACIIREVDSQLVYHLKKHKWIPDKNGVFHFPNDISRNELPSDFIYDDTNGLLTAIGFGENARKLSAEYSAKNTKAQDLGFDSADEAVKYAELKKRGFSVDEFLAKHKAVEQPEKSVPNPERRRTGIIERSENALTKESVRRERSIQPGIAGVTAEAKAYLRAIYTNKNGEMVCQCCQLEMPFKVNDEYYFEAVQCIKEIDNQHIENRLALCPNCAAMYQYARQTSDSELKLSILENSAADDVPAVELPIVLRNKSETIRFVGAHWFDLKTIFEKNS